MNEPSLGPFRQARWQIDARFRALRSARAAVPVPSVAIRIRLLDEPDQGHHARWRAATLRDGYSPGTDRPLQLPSRGITSVNASITLTLTAGSAYSGVIKQYHEVSGFLLARRPSHIRVIGQLPVVGTNIFDMDSDGDTFRIFIPPQNKFIVGPATLERPSDKPIENLRPQHILDAIFWQPIPQGAPVLFEEAGESRRPQHPQHNITCLRCYLPAGSGATASAAASASDWAISRKIWFDRSDLHIARLTTYDAEGKIESDIRYSHWDSSSP